MIAPSALRLIKAAQEFVSVEEVNSIPKGLRGIYVLYKKGPNKRFDVVYVGMAGEGGIKPRLRSHRRKKADLWTHCSIFQVWENIRTDEIKELEGLFRHIYRRDIRASRLNVQRSFAKLKKVPRILSTKQR